MKNLIADWKKQTGNSTILVSPTYDWDSPNTPTEAVQQSLDLYNATIGYWYFSEIGFDNDEIFIKRFNDIYNNNIEKFNYLLYNIKTKGYDWEETQKSNSTSHTGTDTNNESGSRTIKEVRGGRDSFQKGVTTTSTQNIENIGDKLTRSTPNEKLSVEGSSETTVRDSGQDDTYYGGTKDVTETPAIYRFINYDSTHAVEESVSRNKLSVGDINELYKLRSIYKQFALLFENLFMGVL